MTQSIVLLFIFLFICLFMGLLFLYRKVHDLSSELYEWKNALLLLKSGLEKEGKEAEKEEIRHHLHMRALQIRDTVYKQTKAPHPRAIEETSTEIGYHSSTLRNMFGPEKSLKMENFFKIYNSYINTYWKTSRGNIRKVFRGKSSEPDNEYDTIKQASFQLLYELDKGLEDFE
ncbi:hypothetical protein J2S78_001927 [Salibacterium salarium]|uniref:hypothetical protein n=1 Tax=Salibacterium salarium TaxID=284579 RepID=UPI00277F9C73|nr:hypothetical protein [Salibacterium salarium]MDQ0299507.1 hypothetical protein [Salibacterium salarium]